MTLRYAYLAPKHALVAVEQIHTPAESASDTTIDTGKFGHAQQEPTQLQ